MSQHHTSAAGSLDLYAYGELSADSEENRMRAFHLMSHSEQRAAIRRLHLAAYTDDQIARATRLSVEMIRRLLADAQGNR